MKTIKHFDAFAGMGGFTLALKNVFGELYENVGFAEIDKHATACYQHHFKEHKHYGDITTIRPGDIGHIDIFTFGSPCQDFSLAGKREGLKGQRSSLITYAIDIITHARPSIFIWENVKGVFSSNGGADFIAILQAFTNIGGYRLEWQLLNTKWFLPQNRERIYLVGHLATASRDFRPVFPIGENDEIFKRKERKQETEFQTKHNFTTFMTTIEVGTFRTHNDDKGFRKIKENTAPTLPARAREDGSGQPVIKQLPRGKNKGADLTICPTISSNAFQENNFVSGLRRLTEIECERLQGFPDDYTKYGNYNGTAKEIAKTQRYKMIGNSISIPVVEEIAKRLLDRKKSK